MGLVKRALEPRSAMRDRRPKEERFPASPAEQARAMKDNIAVFLRSYDEWKQPIAEALATALRKSHRHITGKTHLGLYARPPQEEKAEFVRLAQAILQNAVQGLVVEDGLKMLA